MRSLIYNAELNVRLDANEKREFMRIIKILETDASTIIRKMIAQYIQAHKNQLNIFESKINES